MIRVCIVVLAIAQTFTIFMGVTTVGTTLQSLENL